MLGLPSGQAVARAMRIHNPLTPDEICDRRRTAPSPRSTGCTCTRRSGTTSSKRPSSAAAASGSVRSGATIVAEVFVGLVQGDRQSYSVAQGQALEAGAAVEDAGRLHHGRPAALRRGHQPDRRHHDRVERLKRLVPRGCILAGEVRPFLREARRPFFKHAASGVPLTWSLRR